MHVTDLEGRTWLVTVTIAGVKRVEAIAGVRLWESADPVLRGLVANPAGDPVLLVDCLYALCQPQAAAAGVDRPGFETAIGGDAIDQAGNALVEGLARFLPSARDLGDAGDGGKCPDSEPPDFWRMVYRLAGRAGVDPDPRTLRELHWMAEAADRANWKHTSQVLAAIVNSNPYRKGKAATPSDFDPYASLDQARQQPLKMPLATLTDLIVGKPPGGRRPKNRTP